MYFPIMHCSSVPLHDNAKHFGVITQTTTAHKITFHNPDCIAMATSTALLMLVLRIFTPYFDFMSEFSNRRIHSHIAATHFPFSPEVSVASAVPSHHLFLGVILRDTLSAVDAETGIVCQA